MVLMTNIVSDFNQIVDELLSAGLKPLVLKRPSTRVAFNAVFADSRKVVDGSIFCAIAGSRNNGHDRLPGLFGRPVLLLLEQEVPIDQNGSAGVIKVASTRAAWAQLASFFSGHPHNQLVCLGITGTNGKTSTVWMIHELLLALGKRSASIGTLGFFIGRNHRESTHTTPDPDVLYPFLAELVSLGYSHVTMEVSSHSLAQGKLHPLAFDVAGFTSFSQDHLDFHGSMESYLDAKCRLFTDHLKPGGLGIFHESLFAFKSVNALKAMLGVNATSYGAGFDVETRLLSSSDTSTGQSRIRIQQKQITTEELLLPMIGDVFCQNFTCALLAVSRSVNLGLQAICEGLKEGALRPVPGRLEPIASASTPCRPVVYVDYAHTPDALEKAILNLSFGCGRVITVFGCGGDRDKSKRPLMGEIASRLSDLVFITSDNPRTEDPHSIIEDIMKGITTKAHVHQCVDRRLAIMQAIEAATCRDIVLLAGKGHESYQQIGNEILEFSDQKEAALALSKPLRWLVIGGGQSGFAALSFLLEKHQAVALTDDKTINGPEAMMKNAVFFLATDVKIGDFEKIVVSPGVPMHHPLLIRAKALGLEVLTEIDLGLHAFSGHLLAVTGTNGKSTTVAMTEFALRELGFEASACGNIGIPPTTLGLAEKARSFSAVIELSSYQLEGCLPHPTDGIAITSFSNDHLARHKNLQEYFETKWKLTRWPSKNGVFVLSRDVADYALRFHCTWPDLKTFVIDPSEKPSEDLPSHAHHIRLRQSRASVGGIIISFEELKIEGTHNQINALTAAILVQNVAPQKSLLEILKAISGFESLPFRCEQVFNNGAIKIINDSKSTNLESTLAALSLAKRPAILLMGGQGKGEPYKGLGLMANAIHLLITFGASGATIAEDAPPQIMREVFSKMEAAVLRALELARDNQLDVIFSPGCASFDEFRNFEHRGQEFNRLVELFVKNDLA